ncbi:MAG: LPP20 family lipoprotein [Hahellaceae bacterium]|nr:LPP20 family lipoprotein [Hahellaceae bacterium]
MGQWVNTRSAKQGTRRTFRLILMSVAIVLLGSCKGIRWGGEPEVARAPQPPIVLRVSGYAALPVPVEKSNLQERLMAMRASKLDAYRAMAEQLYGTTVYGNSRVDQLMLQSDQLKSLVDTTIRGAKVVDVKELVGGGYETVLELELSPDFSKCLSRSNQFLYEDECRTPMPSGEGLDDRVVTPTGRPSSPLYSIAADKPYGE